MYTCMCFHLKYCLSMFRQQDLLKRVVAVKAKVHSVSTPSSEGPALETLDQQQSKKHRSMTYQNLEKDESSTSFNKVAEEKKSDNPVKSLLAAYDSCDDDDD